MSFPLPDNMPALNLRVPSQHSQLDSVELSEELLRHWLQRLPHNNLLTYTETYLDELRRFNRNKVQQKQRLRFLDMYRAPLNNLLEKLTIPLLCKNVTESYSRQKIIHNLTEAMTELATGYKIVVMEAAASSDNLKLNAIAQLAINRACEQIGLLALHAYKFYRRVPSGSFRDLHQLYLVADSSDVADQLPVVNNQLQSDISTRDRYTSILLTSICNPYGLQNGMVFQVYRLLQSVAALAEVMPVRSTSSTPGFFYINYLGDRCPTPTAYTTDTDQSALPLLILNTKPVLIKIDELFQQNNAATHDASFELLQQIAPYLNTSYQRKQPREAITDKKQLTLAMGLKAVHQAVAGNFSDIETNDTDSVDQGWEVLNKNSYGYLVTKVDVGFAHDLKISDFIGIIQPDNQRSNNISLASVRWLRTDEQGFTKMGLKFIEGNPTAVHCLVDGHNIALPALLLPEAISQYQAATLITYADTFRTGATLHIKTRKKLLNFSVVMDKLVEHNTQFERFTFKDSTG